MAKNSGIVVLYDGFCPVCRRSAFLIHKFDILGSIQLSRFQDFPLDKLPIPLEKLSKRVQACNHDLKNCNEGIFAFTSILVRIPPFFPLAIFTFLLGKIGMGQKVYDFIAKNRYNLPFSGMTSIFVK